MGCGLKHTVVLLEDGKVLSCGSNEKGQLGQDERATRPGKEGREGGTTRAGRESYKAR